MPHALIQVVDGSASKTLDLNSPNRVTIQLDNGTIFQFALTQEYGRENVGIQVRLVESADAGADLVIVPEVSNTVSLFSKDIR